MSEPDPRARLNYDGELEPFFTYAAERYGIGEFEGYEVVPVGYEDFNARILTDKGQYFGKVFASYRSEYDIDRYKGIMRAVMDRGVNHPHLYETEGELVVHSHVTPGLSMVMMDYIDGKSFFDIGRRPSRKDLGLVLAQAALINKINHIPPYLVDSWAIPNIKETYTGVRDQMLSTDQEMVDRALDELSEVDTTQLPHSFVHGDLTKSNVLKGANGQIYVIDFSVANWYPRIQELAVIVGNLMNSINGKVSFENQLKQVVDGYRSVGGKITAKEIKVFPVFARAAYAAELVGATKEQIVNHDNTPETTYWLKLGREGLKRAFAT